MSNEIKSFFEKRWVCDKIEKDFHNSEPGLLIEFEIDDFSTDKDTPSYGEQKKILHKMTKMDALKIHSENFVSHYSRGSDKTRTNLLVIEILQPGFSRYIERMRQIEETLNLAIKQKSEPEIQIGKLIIHYDNSLYFGGKTIKMRNQMVNLCRLFMEKPMRLITREDVKERIVDSEKWPTTSNETIAKYVSELHKILKIHFQKQVIFNVEGEGWRFEP